MSRHLRYLLLVLFFTLDVFSVNCQESDQALIKITEKFALFCKSVPYEDIYMQTDRDVYISGEYLWFSIYLFDRQTSSLSSGSSYAYIELLNPVNQPVSQVKICLNNGTGGGGFTLPDSLSNGEYTIRAYTSWMKNFLPSGCFMKNINVYNLFTEKHFPMKGTGDLTGYGTPIVEFFPEGGRIMSGFTNKVGLKVFNKGGKAEGFKGFVTDLSGDTLTAVNVDSTGIGSFEFIPEAGKNYLLTADNGKSIFHFPVIFGTGYSLNVNNPGKDLLQLNINSDQTPGSGNKNWVYLIIQSKGNILYNNKIVLLEKSTGVSIPLVTLLPGINQITVFDPLARPVCDRYFYKPPRDSKQITLKSGDRFGRRAKMDLEIDLGNDSLSADFSKYTLSVSALEANKESNEISDYLILGDEFVIPKNLSRRSVDLWNSSMKSIDDLLLTLKSNWIDWGKILSDNQPSFIYDFEKNGQFLSGTIKNQNKTENNYRKQVFLSSPGKIPIFKYAEVDPENRFRFFIRDYENLQDLIIQPADFNNSYSLIIESPFSERYPESDISIDTSGVSFPDEAVNWSVNYQVDKVYGIGYVGDTIKSKEIHIKPIRFYGKPDQELMMKDYISLPVMQEVFFELVPGIIIKTNKSKYGFYILDPITKRASDNMPALFVDGVIIDDPSSIINLDPELVEEIDVIKSEYIIGYVTFIGIINIITKTGDFSNVPMPRNAVRYTFKGNDYNFKFNIPDYSTDDKKKNRMPDFRNTLYWNSDLKPDKNGKILIHLTASDFISDYVVNFQGASGNKLFSIKKTIRVE
jgi:hypothetical protein